MKKITILCSPILLVLLFISTPLFSQISNLQNFENDVKQILSNVEKTIVSVSVSNSLNNDSTAAIYSANWTNGVIYKDNYILVKDHTITSNSVVSIKFHNGKQQKAEFVGCDDIIGLSVLYCSDLGFQTFGLYDDQPDVSAGNWIIYV